MVLPLMFTAVVFPSTISIPTRTKSKSKISFLLQQFIFVDIFIRNVSGLRQSLDVQIIKGQQKVARKPFNLPFNIFCSLQRILCSLLQKVRFLSQQVALLF